MSKLIAPLFVQNNADNENQGVTRKKYFYKCLLKFIKNL